MLCLAERSQMCQPKAIIILNKVCQRCHNILPNELITAYLCGSYACGDFDDESDGDILLTADCGSADISPYRNQKTDISCNVSLEYDITVPITVKSFDRFHWYSTVLSFYRNVLIKGILYPALEDS